MLKLIQATTQDFNPIVKVLTYAVLTIILISAIALFANLIINGAPAFKY